MTRLHQRFLLLKSEESRPMLAANRHQTACSRLISSIFLVILTVSLPIGLMAAAKTLTADQLFAPEH
ncbi:MAG: hypothetical protein VB862_04805, partial [Pirellulaceae bacterium]